MSAFTLHSIFASQNAHVSALYAAFLGMMVAAGELTLVCLCVWSLRVSSESSQLTPDSRCWAYGISLAHMQPAHCKLDKALAELLKMR